MNVTEIQFWVKDPNDEFTSFNTRLNPVGFSMYSGNSYKSHTVGLFNDHTTSYDSKYILKDVNNVKFIDSNIAQVGEFYGSSSKSSVSKLSAKSPYEVKQNLNLLDVPNHATTFNMRLVSPNPIATQNVTIKVTSISNESSTPSRSNFKLAQIMHPETSFIGQVGSGDSSWLDIPEDSSAITKTLSNNPGIEGVSTGVSSVQHDWFIALSGRSTDVGEQDSKIIFNVEYL